MASNIAGQTRAIHFDYSDLTPFERNVMKNVIPFYTFMRNNLPYQVQMALTQPNKVLPDPARDGGDGPQRPVGPRASGLGRGDPAHPSRTGRSGSSRVRPAD
jgi:hypothetical protein